MDHELAVPGIQVLEELEGRSPARAAVAAGVDGVFLEVHHSPEQALCDGPNSIPMAEMDDLLKILLDIHAAVRSGVPES